MDLHVIACGVRFRHPPSFRIERPRGSGDWLLLQFLVATRLLDRHGRREVPAGWCLLHAPGTRQSYGPASGPFANHWCHLDGDAVAPLVRRLGLPTDEAFAVDDGGAIGRAVAAIDLARRRGDRHWPVEGAALASALLVAAARGRDDAAGAGDAGLRDVRAALLADPQRPWSVAELAARAGLSPSRFAVRYTAAFAVSPIEDLLRARIERARLLLAGGEPVKAVARACGFASAGYFSRQFSHRCGVPPAAFATGRG